MIAMLAASGHVHGQIRGLESVISLDGRRLAVSAEEMRVLTQLSIVVQGATVGEQDRVLLAARRVINGSDARYALATYEFELGRKRDDSALQIRALDALLASGQLPAARLAGHLGVRGQLAFKAGDAAGAEKAWTRLSLLQPGEPTHFLNLAQASAAQERWPDATERIRTAIALKSATGGPAPENWLRQWLGFSQRGRLKDDGVTAALALLSAHPTPANWRASLIVTYDLAKPSGEAEMEFLRLMRAASVLKQGAEYQGLAQLLRQAGHAAEAKAVLAEGVMRGLLNPATSPAREIMAEVDRSLTRKEGRVSVSVASPSAPSRLLSQGRTQLDAGLRTDAVRSFEAVAALPTAGDHALLAKFWIIRATAPRRS